MSKFQLERERKEPIVGVEKIEVAMESEDWNVRETETELVLSSRSYPHHL